MSAVYIRWLAVRTVCAVLAATVIVACGSNTSNDQSPAPEVVATNGPKQTLVILVPTDTSALFTGIVKVVEARSAVPYQIKILEGDSPEAGVYAMLAGQVDLMLLMQRPTQDAPFAFLEMFRTPVVIFVSAELGIDNLTREQAAAIFSGDATNWSQVGGPHRDITVFVQDDDDTATIAVRDYLLGTTLFAESAQVLFSDKDILAVVNGLPGAIGYSSLVAKTAIEQSSPSRSAVSVSLSGIPPEDPAYPIIASVGFAYLPERQADLQTILDWAVGFLDSDMGQMLQAQYGASAVNASPD